MPWAIQFSPYCRAYVSARLNHNLSPGVRRGPGAVGSQSHGDAGDGPPCYGCYRHLGPKGPKSVGCDRLRATRSRSGDLDLQGLKILLKKSAGDRPPRYGILHLYRRARACPSPLLESPITPRGTGPRATVIERLFFPLEFTKRQQRTIRCGDRTGQHTRD